MSIPVVSLFGVDISFLDIDGTVDFLFNSLDVAEKPLVREDLNALKVNLRSKNSEVKKALAEASIVNADGASIVFSVRWVHGVKIPRVTGCDLFERLLFECHRRDNKVFLLGAAESSLLALVGNLNERYGLSLIAGFRNGYFSPCDWDEIISVVGSSGADFLFVGTPSPQKEQFINYARTRLARPMVLMGVGGSFDVVAGNVKRAPIWLQRTGLEWAFRVFQEPRRMWKRYFKLMFLFPWMLIVEKINNKSVSIKH